MVVVVVVIIVGFLFSFLFSIVSISYMWLYVSERVCVVVVFLKQNEVYFPSLLRGVLYFASPLLI